MTNATQYTAGMIDDLARDIATHRRYGWKFEESVAAVMTDRTMDDLSKDRLRRLAAVYWQRGVVNN